MKNLFYSFGALCVCVIFVIGCSSEVMSDQQGVEELSLRSSDPDLGSDDDGPDPNVIVFPCSSDYDGEGCLIPLTTGLVASILEEALEIPEYCVVNWFDINVVGGTLVNNPINTASSPNPTPINLSNNGVAVPNKGDTPSNAVIVPCGGSVRIEISINATCEWEYPETYYFELNCPEECCPDPEPCDIVVSVEEEESNDGCCWEISTVGIGNYTLVQNGNTTAISGTSSTLICTDAGESIEIQIKDQNNVLCHDETLSCEVEQCDCDDVCYNINEREVSYPPGCYQIVLALTSDCPYTFISNPLSKNGDISAILTLDNIVKLTACPDENDLDTFDDFGFFISAQAPSCGSFNTNWIYPFRENDSNPNACP